MSLSPKKVHDALSILGVKVAVIPKWPPVSCCYYHGKLLGKHSQLYDKREYWNRCAPYYLHLRRCIFSLGFTHLIAESFCVVTHRQLSPSHPIFRLLAPHFLFLLAINK